MKQSEFDTVVVGAGHAGCEAAFAAARMGCKTALVSLKVTDIGTLSCNPAMGGLGKGHLVKEIDALDGVMGRLSDLSGIQFRLLNRRKGPAVRGPRAQIDRALYKRNAVNFLQVQENLSFLEGEVVDLIQSNHSVRGIRLADGSEIRAPKTILTTGTFLKGIIHIGDRSMEAGRLGDKASVRLGDRLRDYGLSFGRLKTGTPPRLNSNTINWNILEMQPGDADPAMLSFMNRAPVVDQVSCGITHTNEKTHSIIRDNLDRSAMYGGMIDGVGPRYCPSIEDKVVRFAEKESHQIFLEPEGLTSQTVYPNGISTSLPEEVQFDYVRSIVGLEDVEILQPGYAVEYDYVDPRGLNRDLSLRDIEGLHLAGQINGTTGYEEAAAQGLVAGLACAAWVQGKAPLGLDRRNSYIGVMIDDLIVRGVSEPYRMFTSRAENRLLLRSDNADQRLTPLGRKAGCVEERRWRAFSEKARQIDGINEILSNLSVSPQAALKAGITVAKDGKKRTGRELLAFPDVGLSELTKVAPDLCGFPAQITEQAENDAVYLHYIERQEKHNTSLQSDYAVKIPEAFDYNVVPGLSGELTEKLTKARPGSLGEMSNIEGITPAAMTAVLLQIKRNSIKDAV